MTKSAIDPRYDFEILVKSFLRFDKLIVLVKSIRRRYPGITIRVADDSPDSSARERTSTQLNDIGECVFYRLPENVGISVGRNLLVREVQTPYFVLTDDDKVFTRRTTLERLRTVLEADPDCVIAAGMNLDYGCLLRYQHGHVERDGRRIRRQLYGDRAPTVTVGGVECVPCNLTANFFMASTALFRRHRIEWDERFKLGDGEHVWFFCSLPADLHIYVVPTVRVSHFPSRWADRAYQVFRRNPAEIGKLAELDRIQVDTTRVYESRVRIARRRVERWIRRTIDRLARGA